MSNKVGRNDPCPCGSGKKYKQCCLLTQKKPGTKKKFAAKLLSTSKPVDLMERTFGVKADPMPAEPVHHKPETAGQEQSE
jgi:SEC-C motif